MKLSLRRVLGCSLAVWAAGAQTTPAQDQRQITSHQAPVFQSETGEVSIDAVVTGKKGEAVSDLTAKDFRVWEDNKPQTIQSFSLSAASAAEPRRMVLFFDDTGMSTAVEAGVRQAAAQFVGANAGTAQWMAVVTFNGSYRVVQGFTDDAAKLKEALQTMRLTGSNPAGRPQFRGPNGHVPQGIEPGTVSARGLIQAMRTLAQNLNAVEGRKVIILFSGADSFSSLQPGDVAPLAQICNRSDVAVYPVVEAGVPDASDAPAGPVGQVQPGVPGPTSSVIPEVQPNANIPFTIAKETGGFVVPLSNDLPAALQKVSAEQNQYYVLEYAPPESKEGACHTLRVKVDRKHIDVRARSSYCTGKSQDVLAESKVEQELEKRATTAQSGGNASSAAAELQAPYFYAASNAAVVHVAMEIPFGALKFERQKGKLRAELNVLGIAAGPDGKIAARFSDVVEQSFDREQDVEQLKGKFLRYEKEFKVVPGRYRLTVVYSSGGESSGKMEAPLVIGAYQKGQFALSGLVLSRKVQPAAEIGLEPSAIDEVTPLIAAGMQVIPAGSNVFGQGEHAYCYFEVYESRPAAAMVGLRVLDAKTGAVKWNAGAAKVEPPAGKSTIPVGLSLPTGSLTPGLYTFEVTATGPSGQAVTQTVGFEIN